MSVRNVFRSDVYRISCQMIAENSIRLHIKCRSLCPILTQNGVHTHKHAHTHQTWQNLRCIDFYKYLFRGNRERTCDERHQQNLSDEINTRVYIHFRRQHNKNWRQTKDYNVRFYWRLFVSRNGSVEAEDSSETRRSSDHWLNEIHKRKVRNGKVEIDFWFRQKTLQTATRFSGIFY